MWPLLVIGSLAAVPSPARADAEGRGYRIRVPRSIDMDVGTERSVSLTLLPKIGFSISRDAPVVVVLEAEDGVKPVRSRLERSDSADPRADSPRFDLRIRAETSGRHRLGIRVGFWVCRKLVCRPVRRQLEVAIEVREPPAEPDGGSP